MSMAASKRKEMKMDIRDHRDRFVKKWQPAFKEGADDFLVETERLLMECRRQCIEQLRRGVPVSDEINEHRGSVATLAGKGREDAVDS